MLEEKKKKKTMQDKLCREHFLCIFMVKETFIWTEIWKNQEALITFTKGQDAHHGSLEYPPPIN